MRKFIFLLVCLFPFALNGGGYQSASTGQSALSMGGAFTAIGKGATSVFYNPGAMAFSEKSNVTFGGTFINTKTNYLSPFNGNVVAENPPRIPLHAYINYKFKDNLALGISINSPFGSDFKWASGWEGRYVVQEMKINTWCIQPTVSYKINENFGLGGGIVYGSGSMSYQRAIPLEGTAQYGQEELKINGKSFGFNLGLFYKFNNEGTIGISYRSALKFDMKNGEASFSDIPSYFADTYPATLQFNSYLKNPSVISAATALKFTSQLTVTVQVDYTRWLVFDSLNFIFPDHPEVNIRTGRNSKNSLCGRVGGQFSFTENIDVRIGAAYDLATVPQDHLSPDLPEADKIFLSTGAGYKFNKSLSADLTIGIENYFERKGEFSDANMIGSFKSSSTIIGLGLNYEF